MATQLKEPDPVVEPEGNDNDQAPRDYDAEARQHGWVPQDEFKGDPARWVDAQTFVTRADEVMPLLKKQNEQLKRELAEVKKQARRITEHFNTAEQRLRAEIAADMEKAVEKGDVAGFRKLQAEAEKIGKDPGRPEYTKQDALDAFDEFREANPWVDRGNLGSATDAEKDALAYFVRMQEKHLEKTNDMSPSEFFAYIGGLVNEKYPAASAKAPRQKPPSDVAGATPNRGSSQRGKTFNDLPLEAQRACDKWVKSGLIKDRAAYLASYDWS